MTSITSVDDLRDRCGKKVCGVITRESANGLSFGCYQCDGFFLTINSYKRHINTMHPLKPISISSDDEEVDVKPTVAELKQCFKRPKRQLKGVSGIDDGSSSDSSDNYENNVGRKRSSNETNDDNSSHKCEDCSKSLSTNNNLMRHYRSEHKAKFKYWCSDCPFGCNRSKEMATHKEMHANSPLKHKCSFCNQKFVTVFGMENHKKVKHPNQKYKCRICSAQFEAKANLKEHHKRLHLD